MLFGVLNVIGLLFSTSICLSLLTCWFSFFSFFLFLGWLLFLHMEYEMTNLQLTDEEEDAFREDPKDKDNDFQFCLVGTCLTDGAVHFPSLWNTLIDLWHLINGITIFDLGEKCYLFKIFLTKDIQWVLIGMPWFFNNHLLLFHELSPVEDPLSVNLVHAEFWIQLHELPPGLMFETVAKHFGSFLGEFLEYDMWESKGSCV